ncbi:MULTISPECIES: metallophosphoesterase [unclassified Rhodococcus (in: high G+C Gram-positive bacteria)]|uniref:metallophosphoesterase n=1 Tax=unclassified Rhodococcus (in: high G+C Gram-positive bacteria) TaxID=192944 RepID=UPI0007BC50B1|nr:MULTISPECIES: metallophosphoesterase [unclassified Rhodococcus (in: high G+C Gram-positive bacteria)]KZE99947.1 metallophosphoesterase [Rhodococcus sp. EPR-147]KZF01514.1 metallophosphoesterase [Rhodococcus sp. EPR-279]
MTDRQTQRPEQSVSPDGSTRPRSRRVVVPTVVLVVCAALVGLPAWTVVFAGAQWPSAAQSVGSAVAVAAFVALPAAMYLGHRPSAEGVSKDVWARIGDVLLGLAWIAFVWSALSLLLRLGLWVAGVDDPLRSRIVSVTTLIVVVVLALWGHYEAMRTPRVRHTTVRIDRLGARFDGLRVVLVTDTHFGPLDRTTWSHRLTAAVNALEPDVLAHVGDIADGSVDRRRAQAAPLEAMLARAARVYVTGNHEYFGRAQEWLDHMEDLGWNSLHNRHVVLHRGDDALIISGVDDATAAGSGAPGHGADLARALAGTDPSMPVLLLAHQPKQIGDAVEAGVDLQVSGHTHGGQIWPFSALVRLDQPVVHGLSRHGARTQLYTSRGSGFWGPPFRVFAPSEISVLTLVAG